jgi:hypothetical protein
LNLVVRPLSAVRTPHPRGRDNGHNHEHAAGARRRGAVERTESSRDQAIHHGIPKMHGGVPPVNPQIG